MVELSTASVLLLRTASKDSPWRVVAFVTGQHKGAAHSSAVKRLQQAKGIVQLFPVVLGCRKGPTPTRPVIRASAAESPGASGNRL